MPLSAAELAPVLLSGLSWGPLGPNGTAPPDPLPQCAVLQNEYTYGEVLQPYFLLIVSVLLFGVLATIFSALWWSCVYCLCYREESSSDLEYMLPDGPAASDDRLRARPPAASPSCAAP